MVCWKCGEPATKSFNVINILTLEREREQGRYSAGKYDAREWIPPSKGQRAYCDDCFKTVMAENLQRLEQLRILKTEKSIERAIRILEKGKVDVYRYREAIEKVSEQVRTHPEQSDSSDEIAAAIILVYKGYAIQMQHKIGNYRIDICIPKWKVLLEIDGIHHKGKKKADAERDGKILSMLPLGWRIVRIPTDQFEQNPAKLIEAINALLTQRNKGGVRR
jgi:very-short-patch-repair endonuclease